MEIAQNEITKTQYSITENKHTYKITLTANKISDKSLKNFAKLILQYHNK